LCVLIYVVFRKIDVGTALEFFLNKAQVIASKFISRLLIAIANSLPNI